MTDLDIILKAMNEIDARFTSFRLAPAARWRLNQWMQPSGKLDTVFTLYGLPVHVDPSLHAGEVRFIGVDGEVVRIVNIGLTAEERGEEPS